jgi:hypothetical protein
MKKILAVFIILIPCLLYGTNLRIITSEEFIAENPSSERKSIVNFSVSQFEGKSVSQSDLDKLWNDKETREALNLARFHIVNQQVYASAVDETHPYFRSLITYLQRLVTIYKIEDVDFLVHIIDQLKTEQQSDEFVRKLSNVPTFMFFKNLDDKYEQDRLLMPEALILWDSWRKTLLQVQEAAKKNPWENKIEKLYWRGGTSGNATLPYTIENFSRLPRLSLVILSKLYPDIIDAKFTYYMQNSFDQDKNHDLRTILKILFGEKFAKISEANHLPYKYLISIDGNSCTGTRIPWIMYSNSVLIKQESNKIEWFYSALKPYVNYVPVNTDLTNIFSQFEWIKNHDQEVKQIAINAHNFVARDLMPKQIEAHMVLILNEYHKIQKDQKIMVTLPSAEETRSVLGQTKAVMARIKRSLLRFTNSF